ncbi:MAG TPA: deoxyribose-phosphate aldolase [Lacipirellulaceae bacterium]|jgi:deoxyribose-phosphate aldolase|nr:deoxyribose-phosphate aldolase [Lacipirellulaceae bacterium]
MQTLAIGADHGGFELKQQLAEHIRSRGYAVEDCGTHSTEAVDYPKIAAAVAERVADGRAKIGVIIDGAGIGSSMTANKFPGVRAALCYDLSSARNSREHNNANVLTLGASLIGSGLAKQIVDAFLDTECTADRHLRRAAMIDEIEKKLRTGELKINPPPTTPAPSPQPPAPTLTDLSEADLKRVADRITQLMGGGQGEHACTEACGFCKSCADLNPTLVKSFIDLGADRITHRGGGAAVPKEIAKYIDHTLLRPDATVDQVTKLCQEAKEFGFASVCVNPYHVRHCASLLCGSSVKVCTVIGFPLGANVSETKALEARRAIRDGATEVDMVINIGALKSGQDDVVYRDIRAVVDAAMDGGAICKVILETSLLNDDEKTRGCLAARRARADFVKTATGFGPGGATAEDVALMSRAVSGTKMGVKASGGIRNLQDAEQMIRAGATRIGASAGVRIVKESQGATFSDSGGGKY